MAGDHTKLEQVQQPRLHLAHHLAAGLPLARAHSGPEVGPYLVIPGLAFGVRLSRVLLRVAAAAPGGFAGLDDDTQRREPLALGLVDRGLLHLHFVEELLSPSVGIDASSLA